jgi:hypothetical protein
MDNMDRFWTPGRAILVGVAIAVIIPLGVWTAHDTHGRAVRVATTLDAFNLDNLLVDRGALLPGLVNEDTGSLWNPEALRIENVGFMKANDRVLGVSMNGETRVYPTGMLMRRQVVNDRLGGVPIAVFYCPLSDSATVVERTIDNELLDFEVSGFLYESNLLVYDRERLGLWSQLGFTAVSGPHAGRRLRHVNSWQLTNYKAWCREHPETTVVSIEGSGGRSPYAAHTRSNRLMFPVSRHDDRLADKTPVIGILHRGLARAYPVEQLQANGLILDELAGEAVVLRATVDGSISVEDAPRDALVAHAFWFAWFALHPDTDVWD